MEQQRKEFKLHCATVDYLNGEEWSGNKVIRTHAKPFPYLETNSTGGETPSAAAAFFEKRKGRAKGTFDLHLEWPTAQSAWIELKAPGGVLSREQKTFQFTRQRMGHKAEVFNAVYKVRDQLIAWGLECVNMYCKEPDYSTWDDRINAYLEFITP